MKSIMEAITLLAVFAYTAESARILAVLPIPAQSHHVTFRAVLRTLAGAGHQVTSYTPFPMADMKGNYTEIQVENVWATEEERESLISAVKTWTYRDCFNLHYHFSQSMLEALLRNADFKALLRKKPKFDLIIIEQLTGSEFLTVLGNILKAPIIAVQTAKTNELLNSLVGNSVSPAYFPNMCSPFSSHMSFLERLKNSYDVMLQLYTHYYDYLPRTENRMRVHWPDMSQLLDMVRSVSLTFVNDHFSVGYAIPQTPNIIPVGGIHIRPPGELPDDLRLFMEEAEHGVILFSLGTYVPDHLQTKEYFDIYLGAFGRLRQRVVWKTMKTTLHVPDNVIVRAWLPQQDILAHPKCVLFITHGGQHSLLETIHYGVPVVTIPHFYDQFNNAMFFEAKGVGIKLVEKDITQNRFYHSIKTLLEENRYRENMARLSAVFRDRPLSAARSVVYWVDYVIRHAGAPHLRPVSAAMPWYQRALLDVAASLLLFVFILGLCFYFSVKICLFFCKIKIQRKIGHGKKSK